MTLSTLLADLHRRGIGISVQGGELRYRAPKGSLTPDIVRALRDSKPELVKFLEQPVIESSAVLAVREEPVAYRFYSGPLERDFWLARDTRVVQKLSVEFPGVPVLTFAEVTHLLSKPLELIKAILETKAQFPDARLRQ